MPFAGAMLTLAFSPFDYSYFALIALTILLLGWQNVTPIKAAIRGYLFGVGLFGVGVSWVFVSIFYFGHAGIIGSSLLTLLFVGVWALFPALTGYLINKFGFAEHSFIRLLIIPALWVLIEYFRGYTILNGFPWLQVAYSQLDTPLAGYIPLLGCYGTGYLLIFTLVLFLEIVHYKNYRVILIPALVVIWLSGWGLQHISWTDKIGDSLKVSLIQGNISQDMKWLPDNRIKTLIQYQTMTEQHWDSDIVIWPETAIPAFYFQVKDFFIKPLAEKAKNNNTDLIVSMPMLGNTKYENYNAVMTLGKEQGVYKKNHLLPFGEYMPLQPLSGYILSLLEIRLGNFLSGGPDQKLLKAGGYAFNTSICYEDAFGAEAIRGQPEAAFLVNVTNDAWFGNSIEPHQHMQIARMRALETGRYLLRATNTGLTGVVDPKGKIIKQAPLFETTSITADIYPMGNMTPYASIGDKVIIYSLLVITLILIAVNWNWVTKKV